ncbi:DUF4190 domain-containing protein [Nocardioidaceae bacterium]|nr:DUF4190 domain-containing protein [Nocardioidaceae bacterium]
MSSTGDDDPFRPPQSGRDDDEGRGRPAGGDAQGSQPSGWGWGQQPQDPARASWESSHAQQPGQQYGQQPQQQGPYGQPGQYGGYAPPDHGRATVALVLGLVSLIGGLVCGVPLLASPFALVIGRKAVREIDASGGRLGGRGQAMAGYVMGIIGVVLLALGIIAIVLFFGLIASFGFS